MYISINFANPLGPYDNYFNRCAGRYCHVEMTLKIDCQIFRALVDANVSDAHAPEMLQQLLNRSKDYEGDVTVCFFILWGGVVSVRFLSELADDAFFRPPEQPVYDSINVNIKDISELHKLISWQLKHVGRLYDIPRALCLLIPVTIRLDGNPYKFFCSQMLMHMFKDNEMFDTSALVDINHMKPDCVYDWLIEQKERIKVEDNNVNGSE
jgi:hypothetical protein